MLSSSCRGCAETTAMITGEREPLANSSSASPIQLAFREASAPLNHSPNFASKCIRFRVTLLLTMSGVAELAGFLSLGFAAASIADIVVRAGMSIEEQVSAYKSTDKTLQDSRESVAAWLEVFLRHS